MAPAAVLDVRPGERVLDLCAAPGGKSTQLAAALDHRGLMVSNDPEANRARVLAGNLERMGAGDALVVSALPDRLAARWSGWFDAVLVDAPCSGEGMFRKDAQAVAEWSPETVQFCAARSRRILRDIWPVLRPGGHLIYSTCTFNHLENDDTVAWVAAELGAQILPLAPEPPVAATRFGCLLLPGLVPGEGQYVALLRKNGEPEGLCRPGNLFTLLGATVPAAFPANLPRWDTDRLTALRYLHGDALVLPEQAPRGELLICHQGLPLGPAKNLGKRCNNLYPKAKRIRMDIR